MASGQSKSRKGWINALIWILIICFAVALYSFAWILAIIAAVIIAVKKGPNKKRNLLISIVIAITSFFVFIWINSSSKELTSLQVEWTNSEYDIEETTEVTLSPVPENAEIETLSISDNSIADLEYKDGKAIITFKGEGSERLFFIANDKINSNSKSIKVIDAEAEAQRKAEEERIAQEQAEAERLAAEQAELEEQQRAQEAAAQAQSQPQEPMVWISQTGDKYHNKPNCGNMNPDTATQITKSEAEAKYAPCGRCY